MKIALTGGTGFVGRALTEDLVRQGHDVVQIARHARSENAPSCPRVSFVAANINDEASLARAFEGCEAVAHLAGINREIGRQTYERVHSEGTQNTVNAAKRAGIKKIVLLSFLRARPNVRSAYHRSKWEAEEIVRRSGLDFTILKAGVIYGRGDHMVDHMSKALNTFPLFPLVGLKDKTMRPIAVVDMVRVIQASLTNRRLSHQTVCVVGPEEVALKEVVKRLTRVMGKRGACFPVPVFFHYVLAAILEKIMKVPVTSFSQVRMLSEGISEPEGPCENLPEDLRPQVRFTDEEIRKALPPPKKYGLKDLKGF